MTSKRTSMIFAALVLAAFSIVSTVYAGNAVYTTTQTGTAVNFNLYATNTDVYISGGPQNTSTAGLPDGTYYFQVTDPSGKTLLSTDAIGCRQLLVTGGHVNGSTGPTCKHAIGIFNSANATLPVQLAPFSTTPNAGLEYKVWLSTSSSFPNSNSKTDNFKVLGTAPPPPPPGSCAPSSSLSVLASGTNVAAYVPKGNWSSALTGVSVVSLEGTNTLPTTNPIPTAHAVNSCASNPLTGKTVCTANNTDVYVIAGLAAVPTVTTLTSGGSGAVCFSGGCATNTGIAMDATNNRAVLGLSIAGAKGFQFLNLATSLFEPAFASPSGDLSEDPLIDPIRNLLLSAAENGNYEIVNVATSLTPSFFEHATAGGELDSSGEDCTTGIILAPAEFSVPSSVYIANLSSSSATFTAGSPGSWTAPSQNQILSESVLPAAGASGIAVAQGTKHQGVVADEFGGNALTAIQLPLAADTSSTTPAITDWVTCNMGGSFTMGLDPHTVTAYQSPNGAGDAIAVLANGTFVTPTTLAVVDLTAMLNTTIVPRTAGGHACASGTLPATVVSFIPVP